MGEVRRLSVEFMLWSAVFAIAGIFQVYRGAPLDGTFFLIAVVIMSGIHVTDAQAFPVAKGYLIKIYFLGTGVALLVSRIHTRPSLVTVLLYLPLIPYAMRGRGKAKEPSAPMARSIGIWVALAVAVAFYEMLNFIVGDITDRPYHYPTISMLIDPMLHNFFGRAFFVLCWTWVGYKFIFQKRTR